MYQINQPSLMMKEKNIPLHSKKSRALDRKEVCIISMFLKVMVNRSFNITTGLMSKKTSRQFHNTFIAMTYSYY